MKLSEQKIGVKNSMKIIESEKLKGKYVTLREVAVEDADFILSLRCNEKKSRFLHKTENSRTLQVAYIQRYLSLSDEWYFISEDKSGKRLGTIRIYDVRGNSCCLGSWIMIDGASLPESFETDYLLRMYAFNVLGFNKVRFDVRRENKKVWKYHEFLGAKRTDETELDFFYELSKEEYMKHAENMWKLIQN